MWGLPTSYRLHFSNWCKKCQGNPMWLPFFDMRHIRSDISYLSQPPADAEYGTIIFDFPENSGYNTGKYLRQHRTIASASLRRLFAQLLQLEKREIHTVFLRFPSFELGAKILSETSCRIARCCLNFLEDMIIRTGSGMYARCLSGLRPPRRSGSCCGRSGAFRAALPERTKRESRNSELEQHGI